MSAGLKTLLEAAQFLEQQEKLKLSPQSADSAIGDLGYFGDDSANYENGLIKPSKGSARLIAQVSSSAPNVGATFQHTNGLTVTSGIVNNNSQLVGSKGTTLKSNRQNNVYDFKIEVQNSPSHVKSTESRVSEDPHSSHTITSHSSSLKFKSNGIMFMHATTSDRQQHEELQTQQHEAQHKTPNHKLEQLQSISSNGIGTTLTIVDKKSHISIIDNAAASKQMLLNGGIRIASPAATMGSASKEINSVSCKVLGATTTASTFPLQGTNTSFLSSMPKHKTSVPLTPPPISSRKLVDTHARIRSYSLSSNKFSANNMVQHNNHHMVVDSTHMRYISPAESTSSSRLSPSRCSNSFLLLSAAQQSAAAHITSTSSGRRRTISSNSNGGHGTREVHNILEKNRRAHLKECYEELKNQLQLKDEDRKKTSNLAILGEAHKQVLALQKKARELELEAEEVAKEKINKQKRFNTLKRELGPKYEQLFSGIFPDIETGTIPSDKETDSGSLSSGRGSMIYSSSSSLSSGGNTMSSPVGAGLQTAMPTSISPVITKINPTSNTPVASALSPISTNMLQHFKSVASVSVTNSVAENVTSTINGIINVSNMPLSLTAKNISATSLTRGSPIPSTPSPSPSSSSGVSSSSSLISSSPPMNGVINGRNVTINIPNGLKFQTTGSTTIATVGNGAIITTSPTGNAITGPTTNNGKYLSSWNTHCST